MARPTPFNLVHFLIFTAVISSIILFFFGDQAVGTFRTLHRESCQRFAGSPNVLTSPTTFIKDENLEDLGPRGNDAWESLTTEKGGFLWVQTNGTTKLGYGISMFHALHCLQMLRTEFQAQLGLATHTQPHHQSPEAADHIDSSNVEHLGHCLAYVAMMINCAGDSSLEPPNLEVNEDTGLITIEGVDGVGTQHQCRNVDHLWAAAESSERNPVAMWKYKQGDTVESILKSWKSEHIFIDDTCSYNAITAIEKGTMVALIAFDLDGTLAESKQPLKDSMGEALADLLTVANVAVISGGDWPQFEKQVASRLPARADLSKLWLMPTTGTKLYVHKDGKWQVVYAELFSEDKRKQIIAAFDASLEATGFTPGKTWGERIEDRGSQITFSALGQEAPIAEKKLWDPDFAKRRVIQADLYKRLPDLSINMGGATSIDITQKGIDKAYGLKKLRDASGISLDEMIFIGDAIFPGGNDYPAKELGVKTVLVKDPDGTLAAIAAIVNCLK